MSKDSIFLILMLVAIVSFIVYGIIKKIMKNKKYEEAIPSKSLSLYNLSLSQLFYEFKLNVASPNPKDLTLFGEKNASYKLRIEQQKLIIENIQSLVDLNMEFLNLKAIEVINNEILDFLIEDKHTSMKNLLQIKAEQHNVELTKLKCAREFENLKIEADKAILRGMVADVSNKEADLKIKVEMIEFDKRKKDQDLNMEKEKHEFELSRDSTKLVNEDSLIKEKIKYEKLRVSFMDYIVENSSFDNLPNGLKTFIICSMVNPSSDYDKHAKEEILNEYLSQQIEAELEMKRYKNQQESYITEDIKNKYETKKDERKN